MPGRRPSASDVFSLGATLLFAATGHPPYQGDTVMDVLVRLATEPPDLAGLPAELTRPSRACLDRDPRDRPDVGRAARRPGAVRRRHATPGAGHAYLPAPALALIEEYQRSPQPPPRTHRRAPVRRASDDATFGSYTALAARNRGRPGRGAGGAGRAAGTGRRCRPPGQAGPGAAGPAR